jgi:hypothetical protein
MCGCGKRLAHIDDNRVIFHAPTDFLQISACHRLMSLSSSFSSFKSKVNSQYTPLYNTKPTHFYSNIRIVSTIMPTLRVVYLTEQQYAGMTDHVHGGGGAANNTTAEEQLPFIDNQEQTRLPIDDATRNTSSNKESDHEEDNDYYLDTLLQEEAIDGVNDGLSFGENDSSSSERVRVEDAVQQFQHEMVSSDDESENDSTPSPAQADADAVQQKSGNKRKRPVPIQSFDDRFNDLMAFKAKYGHCDVPQRGENASIGKWCKNMRASYKKIQNNKKPKTKLSDEQIQRLNDAGFKWSIQGTFDERFNDLMAFKAMYSHCDVSKTGKNASLGQWCSEMRASYKKIQNNQKPKMKLSDEQIQRLNDAGFKWYLRALPKNGPIDSSV